MNAWVLIAKISWGPIGPSRTNHGQMLGWWRGNHRSNFSMQDFPLQELYSNYCPYNCLYIQAWSNFQIQKNGEFEHANPEKWRVSTCKSRKMESFNMFEPITKMVSLEMMLSGDNPARSPWVYTLDFTDIVPARPADLIHWEGILMFTPAINSSPIFASHPLTWVPFTKFYTTKNGWMNAAKRNNFILKIHQMSSVNIPEPSAFPLKEWLTMVGC